MGSLGFIFWNKYTRLALFWALFAGALSWLDLISSKLNFALIIDRVGMGIALLQGKLAGEAGRAALASLSGLDFVFSLSYAIGAIAIAFAACFLALHVSVIVFTLRSHRRRIEALVDREAFAGEYENGIYPQLIKSPLIGHAWLEFDETLVRQSASAVPIIQNTVRPQSFVNIGIAREKLLGLKMLSGIPGYFVAIGLLLTFTGIVLALYKAGAASSAEDVKVMQHAMTELLQIASFKFATSIAGLGCSLALSILFKIFLIWIEGSFTAFCDAVERKLKYVPPQSLALEMNEAAKEQRDQLKEINSDKFFAQMGKQLEPQIQSAFTAAMSPVNASISAAMDRITETSQSGVSEMLDQFTNSVQSSAGTELRELAETLKAMQVTLAETQSGVKGSGEDFARRMSEAAENLNRLVGEAARSLDDGADRNREGLAEIMAAMKSTFEAANGQIEAQLGSAAGGASDRIEEAMSRIMEKLEGQIGNLSGGLSAFDENMRDGLAQTQEQIRSAQEGAVQTVAEIAASSAEAIRSGLADAISTIREEVSRFETALRGSGSALASQASAIGDATSQTRLVSDAFAKTANDVRAASAPLIQSGEKIAAATSSFERSLDTAVEALVDGQDASGELATSIRQQGEQLVERWNDYEQRFVRIDEALAKAVTDLAGATETQGAALSQYALKVDKGLGEAVQHLASSLESIQDSVEEFGDAVSALGGKLPVAAE